MLTLGDVFAGLTENSSVSAKYVAKAAERVALGEVKLDPLRHAPYQEAKEVLTSLLGVGDKVADCSVKAATS